MPPLDWLPPDVRATSTRRELRADEPLFRQGDKTFAIFEVEEGRLRLIRHTSEDHDLVLLTARPGDMLAEAALFAEAYHCDGIAAVNSHVRVYPKRALLKAFRKDPALGERFMAMLAHQVVALRSRLEERDIRSARARILHHLALLAGPDGRTVSLDGTLMDLAADLGLTREVLYRTLAALQKDGTIARTRSSIMLKKIRTI